VPTAYQEAVTIHPCPACDADRIRTVTQASVRGELRWDAEWECAGCGAAEHEGGAEPAPDWLRAALLAAHGPWVPYVPPGTPRPALLRALRRADPTLTLRAAAAFPAATHPTTRTEAAHLAAHLRAHGIPSRAVPAPGGFAH
jgi:hypothetical protein